MFIYLITNTLNNKKYIGQTTKNPNERWEQHKNQHRWSYCPLIDSKIGEYGVENFIFETIDETKSQAELDELEKKYILEFETHVSTGKGYNIKWGGIGGRHAEETKIKIGAAQIGSLNHMHGKTGVLNPTSKKIIELTTGAIFGSAMEAGRELKLNFSHICAVARGERGSAGGKVFRYLDEANSPIRPDSPVKIKSLKIREEVKEEYRYLL